MIYELRTYHVMPGRMPDLLSRFENYTLKIWEKHGIRQAGFWTTLIGEDSHVLYYMLKWESLAEREAKWPVFVADPEWVEARRQTEGNGLLVSRWGNQILASAPFSALK
jgi:hypothetical protein